MSVLKDIFEVDKLTEQFKEIRSPEDLQKLIQSGRDVFDKHITELKNIPSELERWQSVAQELGILSENTDYVNFAKDTLFQQAIGGTKGTFLEGRLGLENLLSVNNQLLEKNVSQYSIGGIKIDYLYTPKPDYSTRAYSQPIVSSSNIDTLSEHAENENTTVTINCILTGDDARARFNNINQLRENKAIIQIIADEVYNQAIITRLRPKPENSIDELEFSIEIEQIFVAQLKRVSVAKSPAKTGGNLAKQTTSKKLPYGPTIGGLYKMQNPIPPELKPTPTLYDMVRANDKIGYTAPLTFDKKYNIDFGGGKK